MTELVIEHHFSYDIMLLETTTTNFKLRLTAYTTYKIYRIFLSWVAVVDPSFLAIEYKTINIKGLDVPSGGPKTK